jgi:hypothetical protein
MALSFLLRWLPRVYSTLLYAYPPGFRRLYGKEMQQVFVDRCRGVAQTQGLGGLLRFGVHIGADWVTTTIREGIASMRTSAQISGAADPILDGVPVFFMCDLSGPPRSALLHGAALSLAAFIAVTFLLAHSGDRRIIRLIGSHHPSRSHLLPAQASGVPSTDLETEIKAKPFPDEPPVSTYFKLFLVLSALDTDRDNVISAVEIAHSPAALAKLDKNHDGKLSAEECGAGNRARLVFMRIHPVLAALDADHDGEISASEIKHAPAALLTLDKNGDGQLTEDELLPGPTHCSACLTI